MKYEWLNKKTPRSVDLLRLWPENPRLNPEERHLLISDFAEDFTNEEADKKQFFKLIKSIADDGFIPADPVVVWKNEENDKYYVAEGNRRVLALKLLRDPSKAPKSIRGYIRNLASQIDANDFEKILVNVAPTLEDAEWYINQRNSTSSLQQSWSRIQQQRWISELYNKYNGDIEKISAITKMTQGELENFIRILKINDLTKLDEVKSLLTPDEYEEATSYKFPITILERFFSSKEVKESWGIEYDGIDLKFKNKSSFLEAYAQLIKDIVNKNPQNIIDTRTITSNLELILQNLPKVDIENIDENIELPELNDEASNESEKSEIPEIENSITPDVRLILKNNPNRDRLILTIYEINTDSFRIQEIFEELKRIPFKYNNCISASIRIFLDLTVYQYIKSENLEKSIEKEFKKSLRDVPLMSRLEYLKKFCLNDKPKKIVEKLLESKNDFSLDVLNGYMHTQDAHFINREFLNRFWDFLFPLFEKLVDIKEISSK